MAKVMNCGPNSTNTISNLGNHKTHISEEELKENREIKQD